MNWNAFKNSVVVCGLCAAIIVGYLADNSFTRWQNQMTLIVAILLAMLVALVSLLVALPKSKSTHSTMSAEQRANALLFRHQPLSANFRVRAAHAEQMQRKPAKFYAINPDHPAFK
jgi:hypothetical protein